MLMFNADLPVDNAKLPELSIFGKRGTALGDDPKPDLLLYVNGKIEITLKGSFVYKLSGGFFTLEKGTITEIDVVRNDEDRWQIKEISINAKHFVGDIGDGKLATVISDLFDKKDQIDGSFFDDKLSGFNGSDHIRGWNGDDRIDGNRGNDVLIGGFGNDDFVFDTNLNRQTNVDVLDDFRPSADDILLDRHIFSAFTEKGMISGDNFRLGDHARDADDFIIYWPSKGKILYDADGSGSEDPILFAKVDPHTNLSHRDFFVF